MTTNFRALTDYLKEISHLGFQWHLHDCFQFTNEAFRRMYGKGWADDWSGKYISNSGVYKKRSELIKTFGFDSLEAGIDSKLKRIDYTPPRGALVTSKAPDLWAIDKALGISIGLKAAFLGKKRLIFLPIQKVENGWINER